MFATRNFPLQSNSLCHFRYQFGPLLTRMLTQSQWGYAATSRPQAHVEDFSRISIGPSCPVAGARRRWFEGDPDRSPRPRRGEFSQFWRRESSVRSPARGERPTLYGGACQSRDGWARLCNAEDCAAMIGCLGRPGFDRRSHQVLAPNSGTRLCVVRRSLEPKRVWWRTFAGSGKRRHTEAGAQGSLSRANR